MLSQLQPTPQHLADVPVALHFLWALLPCPPARPASIPLRAHPQVCREAYPPLVCALLWVLAEVSIVALDLTMVLGGWHGCRGRGS